MNLLFPELPSPKMHPANIGHDLTRDSLALSEQKRRLYLDRALNLTLFRGDFKNVMRDLRTVFLTGAKLVCRAYAPETMGDWDAQRLEIIKFYIDLAHSIDPELIFDAYISDEIHPTIEYIKIPKETFLTLGLEPENRFFDYAGKDDLTEQKLWFIFRASQFKNAGFESLTFAPGVPPDIPEMFRPTTPLVFADETAAPVDADAEAPTVIAERWIAQKQRER